MTAQTKTSALIAAAALLTEQQDAFKVGDVVVWKDGLQNKRVPEYGQPVVVTRAYEAPIVADRDSGSPYFNEPMDVALFTVDEDGDAIEMHSDSRRFRIATKEDIDAWDKKQAEAE